MKDQSWVYSKSSHKDWGRYLGTFNESYWVDLTPEEGPRGEDYRLEIEEKRHEIRFENHLTQIRRFLFKNVSMGVYDSRYHIMYLGSLLDGYTEWSDGQYAPIYLYLINLIPGATVQYPNNILRVGIPPVNSKILEDMCGPGCPYHPYHKLTEGGSV